MCRKVGFNNSISRTLLTMSLKNKILFGLWSAFSIYLTLCISLAFFALMSLLYSEKHNQSSAGDHVITARRVIIGDIFAFVGTAYLYIGIFSLAAFYIHQLICDALYPKGRRMRGFSFSGLLLFAANTTILCVFPLVASAHYYLDRVPYFPK